jgi:hypothetical protein
MTRQNLHDLIDRVLDDVAAHPDRVSELKRSLRARITAPEPFASHSHPAHRPLRRPASSADLADDSMWDNMPV